MSAETLLDACFIPGGLWEGAPVIASMPGTLYDAGVPAVVHGPDGSGGWSFGVIGERHVQTTADGWRLSLRLPGPRNLGSHGLDEAIAARLSGVAEKPFIELLDFGADYEVNVSRYLAMTDALAASRAQIGEPQWATGPGAPVYGWCQAGRRWLLTRNGGNTPEDVEVFACALDITGPMEALEAVWRAKVAP